jgi:GntR family transcriptional regulator / MocR family aminotransferase
VLHIGCFSKTISPTLRLGFMVVPPELVRRFGDVAACLAPAPAAGLQRAVAELMREGFYLRHLRHMKRLYAARREAILRSLDTVARGAVKVKATAGLAVVIELPQSVSDADIALRALPFGRLLLFRLGTRNLSNRRDCSSVSLISRKIACC